MKTHNRGWFVSLMLGFLLIWQPLSATQAQYRDVPVDGVEAPVYESTDQFVITLNPTSSRTAVDTTFWRQFNDVSARSIGPQSAYKRQQGGNAHVLKMNRMLTPQEIVELQYRWKQISEVALVEPDIIMRAAVAPNDPEYSKQWDMVSPLTPIGGKTYFGMNAIGAWDAGYSGAGTIVSIIDTGITPHPDLAGQVVSQYDFISEASMSNDGNGRDTDATDAGDFDEFSSSSWHGTHVAGTVAALRNNSLGVAGIANGSKLMVARVLGSGGGYSSDIADAIRWSARLYVPGVALVAKKANVINMSLGGSSATCPSIFGLAINDATAAGTMVVVAAGNSATDAQNATPANCAQAVTVAATGPTGGRASYSNYGTMVDIAAPGGNGGDSGSYPLSGGTIRSTLWSGATTLASGSASYANYQGTSMAAPHVAGVAALLYGIKPSATVAEILAVMRANVTAFPVSSCTTSLCGAGILNAGSAAAALQSTVGTLTPTAVVTPSTTLTPSRTATATNTRTATNTLVPSATRTSTMTATSTRTPTPTQIPTMTLTPSETLTPSTTLTPSETLTPSSTPIATVTRTPTQVLRTQTILYESFDVIAGISRGRHANIGVKLRCRYAARTCISEVADGVQGTAGHIDTSNTTELITAAPIAQRSFPSLLSSVWVRSAGDATILKSTNPRNLYTMAIVGSYPVCSFVTPFESVSVTGTTPVADSKWHQIACLLTPGNTAGLNVYVDGVANGVAQRVRGSLLASLWLIGSSGRAYSLIDIDELVVATGRIDATSIGSLYNQQAPVGAILLPTLTLTPSRTASATKTPSPTRTATRTHTPTHTQTATAAPTETFVVPPTATPVSGDIVNPDFELGSTGWTESSSISSGSVSIGTWPGFPSWFGTVFAWIGGMPSEVATIAQTITVPADATTLRVHQGMASYETSCVTSADKARFTVNGTTIREWTLCNRARWTTAAEYDTLEFDLSTYAGQSVTLAFVVDNNAYNTSSWYINTVNFVPARTNTTLTNGDFSVNGDGNWAENSRNLGEQPGQMILGGVAKLGTFGVDTTNLTTRRISQYVTIPASTKSLLFSVTPRTNEFCGAYYDALNVEVDEVVVGRVDICRSQRTGQWSIDMTPYINKRVKIGFNYVTDSSIAGEAVIDDVSLSTDPSASIRAPMLVLPNPKVMIIDRLYQK